MEINIILRFEFKDQFQRLPQGFFFNVAVNKSSKITKKKRRITSEFNKMEVVIKSALEKLGKMYFS